MMEIEHPERVLSYEAIAKPMIKTRRPGSQVRLCKIS